jgi:hypothetical protein
MILSQSRSLEEELNAEMVSHATHIYFLEEALRIAQASNPSVAHAKKSGSDGDGRRLVASLNQFYYCPYERYSSVISARQGLFFPFFSLNFKGLCTCTAP